MNQKGISSIVMIMGMVILSIFLIVVAYYFGTIRKVSKIQNPTINTSQIIQATSTPIPSSSLLDEANNWKTYTNTTYNYSFSYPNNKEMYIGQLKDIDGKYLTDQQAPLASSVILYSPIDKTFHSYLDIRIDKNSSPSISPTTLQIKESHPMKVGNRNGIEYILKGNVMGGDLKSSMIYLNTGNYYLVILHSLNTSTNESAELYQQILSTFKFKE